MAMPTSVTVEIEFTAGVWTDVTAYLDGQAGGSTRFGRTSPYGASSPGTLTLTLANDDGRFTPGRQVLADGVTAHPYYPNVVPRKRIRVAYVVAAVSYYRFTGYIKGWPPAMVNGDTARVTINAATVDDRLSRVFMQQPIQTQIAYFDLEYPGAVPNTHYWPCTDAAGSSQLADIGGSHLSLPITTGNTTGATLGVNGPGIGSGTAASFAPSNSTTGQWFLAAITTGWFGATGGGTLVAWINPSSQSWAPQIAVSATGAGINAEMGVNNGNAFYQDATSSITGPAVSNGAWHMLAIRYDGHFFVDGVDVGAASPLLAPGSVTYRIGAGINGTNAFNGSVGHVYSTFVSLTATDISYLWGAGAAGLGETVDKRIGRFLRSAGLATTDSNLDVSTVTLSTYDQTGKDVVTACQDAATSEGGGSVFYVGTDGKAQFRNRNNRLPAAPTLTLDAEADLDGQTFTPAYDDTQIINQVQATRETSSGSASSQTANDATSQSVYGLTTSSFTSYADSDADVLANAQWQIAQQRNPGYQFGQIALDLATATTAALYAAVASVDVGARIRVSNLPAAAAPTSQIDVFVEGWADTFSTDQYTVVFDTSPAASAPGFKWDDATYGRWGADGNTVAALTNSATTVVITTAAGKATFTTDPTMYPLKIAVGAEHIQLNSAPGGSTSPQTFTGATRGADGTTAAAQAGGTTVDVYPTATWSL